MKFDMNKKERIGYIRVKKKDKNRKKTGKKND